MDLTEEELESDHAVVTARAVLLLPAARPLRRDDSPPTGPRPLIVQQSPPAHRSPGKGYARDESKTAIVMILNVRQPKGAVHQALTAPAAF